MKHRHTTSCLRVKGDRIVCQYEQPQYGKRAGEYIAAEMRHFKLPGTRAVTRQQIIAIGLAQARKAGVKVPWPKK